MLVGGVESSFYAMLPGGWGDLCKNSFSKTVALQKQIANGIIFGS